MKMRGKALKSLAVLRKLQIKKLLSRKAAFYSFTDAASLYIWQNQSKSTKQQPPLFNHPTSSSSYLFPKNHHSPPSPVIDFCCQMISGLTCIQLYQSQRKSKQIMNFLLGLFSCSELDRSDRRTRCISSFCTPPHQKNRSQVDRVKAKQDLFSQRTSSNCSKPASTMVSMATTKLPAPRYISLRGCFNSKEREIQWGFLVGTVNYQPRHEAVIPNSSLRIGVGINEEVSSLLNLRTNSMDKLVVFWSEITQNYTMSHYIRSRQPLIFIVEEWPLLVRLVEIYEQELLKNLGEYCLLQSVNRVFFNIITLPNKYALEFQEGAGFVEHVKGNVEAAMDMQLSGEDMQCLLEKMTLNDYVELKRDQSLIVRKVKHYISQINRERQEKVVQVVEVAEAIEVECQQEEKSVQKERKASRSSSAELQACYFASKRKAEESVESQPSQTKMDDENLLIFYFNNGSDIQEEEHPEEVPVNRANNFFRKIRSKSQDATYIPDEELDLDDEFFHKYA